MRSFKKNDHLSVRVIAGTHVILMALDMPEGSRAGLRGFAIKRGDKGKPQEWLRGTKYFEALVPNPLPKSDYSSRDQPFQSFLWSDYRAEPGAKYDFTIVALYGDLGAFEERHTLEFSVETEPEIADGHGVWFNRGAIASHAFATQFNNKRLTDAMTNAVSDDGKLLDKETAWLSRGLAEACLRYINSTKAGEGLRVCAYEFTYLPVLKALKRAHDRGVDLQIVFHDTKKEKDANRLAIGKAGLPDAIVHPRTRTKIPHNKFMVKLAGNKPVAVWTGSTNFTDTGMFGQTNVGHQVEDGDTAETYLKYWSELKDDPTLSVAKAKAIALTPNPPAAIKPKSIVPFFSPRKAENMLDWYGQRIGNSASLAMMTIPFNVAPILLTAFDKKSAAMRLVILEDEPTADVTAAEKRNRGKLAFSNGEILGKSFVKFKTSFGGAEVTPIPNSDLDKWFIDEELARPTNNGHVFFVHSKFLLIDPLSDDPLVCSGSANFSKNSLVANDENMLLIRGNRRIADIYMTEFDRIFRHFRARDIINQEAEHGHHKNPLLLDTTDTWIGPNFQDGTYKNNRRLLFFPTGAQKSWSQAAANDPDAFADEDQRAKAKPKTAPKSAVKKTKKKAAAKTKPPVKKAAKKKTAKPKPTAKAKKKSAKPKPTTKARKAAGKKKAVKKAKAKRKR